MLATILSHVNSAVDYLRSRKLLYSIPQQYLVIANTVNLREVSTYHSPAYSHLFLYTYVPQLPRSIKNINTVPAGEVNSRRAEETHRQPPQPARPFSGQTNGRHRSAGRVGGGCPDSGSFRCAGRLLFVAVAVKPSRRSLRDLERPMV